MHVILSGERVNILPSRVRIVLTKTKETNVIDTDSILKTLNEKVTATNAEVDDSDKVVVSKITQRVDTESQASCQNTAQQGTIGVKEGTIIGISKHVGTNEIDSILHTMNGNLKKAKK